jgi:glycosyltransferase involved in cell wall biosynthesis
VLVNTSFNVRGEPIVCTGKPTHFNNSLRLDSEWGGIAPQETPILMKESGILDGCAVLRFAHAFETGGGTERYLDDLDHALLTRNVMQIVRIYLTRDLHYITRVEEKIGRGTLVRVQLPIHPGNDDDGNNDKGFRFRLKQWLRDQVLYNPLVWTTFGARWTASRRLSHHPGQALGAGDATADVLRNHHIDLVMLHFFGGADADEVMMESEKAGVPIALLNHYCNDRFLHLAVRKHAMQADHVAGVSGLDVPHYVRDRFTNLYDGIDTAFFRQSNARPLSDPPPHPIVLLPGRVAREKGQMDLIRAAALLRQSGVKCSLAFAGRIDSPCFVRELHQAIARMGMNRQVHFLGELSMEELRDWYAASAVVAFPTYNEGLGRVSLEAQAMSIPVVAYATGGVPEGIRSGHTGYLVPTGDISGFADRLRELLASPILRSHLGTNGRQTAETCFSLACLADRHERFYSQIIQASKVAA